MYLIWGWYIGCACHFPQDQQSYYHEDQLPNKKYKIGQDLQKVNMVMEKLKTHEESDAVVFKDVKAEVDWAEGINQGALKRLFLQFG